MREQIIAQISLGITGGNLKVGEKLPSTREIARRFQIHQNTVSAAYRRLAERNLVEFKKGSGFYVCKNDAETANADVLLERLISRFFQDAAAHGFSTDEIIARLQNRLAPKSSPRLLIVESDSELRKILTAEISAITDRRVDSISFERFSIDVADDAQILIFDKSNDAQNTLPHNKNRISLKANSVADSMAGQARPPEHNLIAVVSGWEKFTELAKMFLLAARIAPETLIFRSPNQTNWKSGLSAVSMIICDAAAAKEFPNDNRVRVFRLIADSSLNELRKSIA